MKTDDVRRTGRIGGVGVLLLAGALSSIACFSAVGERDGGPGGGSGGGMGQPDANVEEPWWKSGFGGGEPIFTGDAGPDGQCVVLQETEEVCATPDLASCGGTRCGAGQSCCLATGTCVDTASLASLCPVGSTTHPSAPPCSSNADCGPDAICESDLPGRCIGPGHCRPLTVCPTCYGGNCPVCGCNGVTYGTVEEACVARVRVSTKTACGQPEPDVLPARVGCGADADCGANEACCALDGRCFRSDQPWRCQLQPDAGILDCEQDPECVVVNGAGGGSGSPGAHGYCAGPGCSGPGRCQWPTSTSGCSGEVSQVCGCNGVTYVNACWASADAARVASAGSCP